MASRWMAKDKSPGRDGVPAEVLQRLDEDNRRWPAAVIGRLSYIKLVPDDLVKAELVTIFKNPDAFLCVFPAMHKLYTTTCGEDGGIGGICGRTSLCRQPSLAPCHPGVRRNRFIAFGEY